MNSEEGVLEAEVSPLKCEYGFIRKKLKCIEINIYSVLEEHEVKCMSCL